MNYFARSSLSIVSVAFLWLLAGCATTYTPTACNYLDPEEYTETSDPFESANRVIFKWNEQSDRVIFEPVARAYKQVTPDPVEHGVSNFFRNLKEPRNMISSTLAGKLDIAATSGVRFVFNSTVGLFGFVDVADKAGMPYKNFDFGNMFAYWGVGDGPYIVLPVRGPTNLRDSVGSFAHVNYTYVEKRIKKSEHQTFVQVGSAINTRAQLLPFTDILAEQPDPYIFARESYRQSRLNTICNP